MLFTHPKVAGVAVVAMPDPRLVERACAFVIPRPGQTPTLAELVASSSRISSRGTSFRSGWSWSPSFR